MIQICHKNKEKVYQAIRSGHIDAAELSFPNLIDEIILTMKQHHLLSFLTQALVDKRKENKHIPLDILLTFGITAKLKQKTSLTDVPFAISDAELLAELGWNLWDNERSLSEGLFSESVMRKFLAKYSSEELVTFYNQYVQHYVMKQMEIQPTIHILDCTKIPVNLENENFEYSSVAKIDGEALRGYKLGALRGVMEDSGIIEEITFGTLKTHDIELCKELLYTTTCFQEQDILINDKGFLSRDIINYLKIERKVDTYLPAKENMILFQDAIMIAKTNGNWKKHPNKKRKHQEIQLVTDLGTLWQSESIEQDVAINACVVHDTKTDDFFVFMTTDVTKTARQIIQTYELRPEIEEDFRQLKDFWKLEDFKSTKYNYITYHIVMTLLGYVYFQLYKTLEQGQNYQGKSLPILAKHYSSEKPKEVLIYAGQYFGIFSFLEFLKLYAECPFEVRQLLDVVLARV